MSAWMSAGESVRAYSFLKRSFPLTETGYSNELSTRYFSSQTGYCASQTEVVCPSVCHSSSAMCGAKGASSTVSGSRISRFEQPPNSFRQIMKAATEVLNEKFSMSSRTFFIVL